MTEVANAGGRRERKHLRKQWWKQSPEQWSTFLISLGAQEVKTTGARVSLCCPYHVDSHPSASLHTQKGGFKCWSANCGHTEHDPIKLVERLANCSYADALDTFKRFFNLTRSLTSDEVTGFYQDEKYRKQLKLIADAVHYYACSVWLADTVPETAKNSVKWLKQRGIADISKIQSLGLMPRQADLEKCILAVGGTQDDAEAAKRHIGLGLTTQLMDAVVFIYARSPREITAFKLRIPGPEKEIRTIRVDADDMGAFGVFEAVYAPFFNHETVKNFTVVEGEFDQIALYQGQLAQGSADEIVFAMGGNGNSGLGFAADLGFSQYNIIGDDDEAGSNYPKTLLKSSRNLSARVFVWPASLRNTLPGKIDPDEAVKLHGFTAAYSAFFDPANYVYAAQWCADKVKVLLKDVDAEDIVGINKVATEWGSLLRNEPEREFFARAMERAHPDLSSDTLLKAVKQQSDGVLGFEQRILDWALTTFHPIWMDPITNELHLWHKVQRMTVVMRMGTPAGMTTFKAFVPEGSIYHWVQNDIGMPGYFPDVEAEDATPAALDKIEMSVSKTIERALHRMASLAPKNNDKVLGQGIHLHRVASGGPGYIVNGTRVYKLLYENNVLISAVELEGPSDDGIIFDIEYNATLCRDYYGGWADYLNSAEDITRPPKYTLEESFNEIRMLIDRLFNFENQSTDVMLCTCLVFYTNILTCITNYRTVVHIQGLFESGKTTLLSIIGNSAQLGDYSLTRHAAGLVTFTQAAFFQSFKNSALFAALDEMNDADDRSSESAQKQNIWMNLRTLVTSGKTHKVVGTRQGTARPYTLFNSVMTAAATPIVHDMDASRAVTIRMSKKEGMESARALLPVLIPHQKAHELRHSIFHHSLRMAAEVPVEYKKLYALFSEDSKNKHGLTLDRSIENVMPLAAIANKLGLNGFNMLRDYRVSRQSVFNERKAATHEHAILDAILNAPRIEIDTDMNPRMRSIRSLLLDLDNREKINQSSQGVYFDAESMCIGIAWDNLAGLVHGTRYSQISKASMKSLADQTEHFIPVAQAMQSGTLARLKAAGLAGARMFSVYNVQYILSDFEQALKTVQVNQKAAVQPSAVPS